MTRREYWERRVGPSRWFGTKDVARICDASQRSVQRWIQDGRLLALQNGRTTRHHSRVPRECLLEFLIGRTAPAEYPQYVEVGLWDQ